MNDKIYFKGALSIPLSQLKTLRDIKAKARKKQGLIACGQSFDQLMKGLNE